MKDSQEITTQLIKVYKTNDWLMNFGYRIFVYLTGIKQLSKELNVLDCGCGLGHLLFYLQRIGFKNISGIDASFEMTEYAKKLVKGQIICGDVLEISHKFTAGSFDIITAMNLQHHIGKEEEWEKFIKGCREVIKPGGLIFFWEPYQTLLFNSLRWLAKYSFFSRSNFLNGRFRSLSEEEALLSSFLSNWPRQFKGYLKNNKFKVIKERFFLWHHIVVSCAQF